MRIEHETCDGRVVMRVVDRRIDTLNADDFVATVGSLLPPAPAKVVLEISKVEFIDRRGIGAILSIYRELGTAGELVVMGVREPILSLFRLARIDHLIRVYTREPDATAPGLVVAT